MRLILSFLLIFSLGTSLLKGNNEKWDPAVAGLCAFSAYFFPATIIGLILHPFLANTIKTKTDKNKKTPSNDLSDIEISDLNLISYQDLMRRSIGSLTDVDNTRAIGAIIGLITCATVYISQKIGARSK
jgi:hypothetical protein